MKKSFRNIYYFLCLLSVLPFTVSASNGIANGASFSVSSVSEPFNMLLVGIGLIGIAGVAKSRASSN